MLKHNQNFTGYNSKLKDRARELRKSMTPQERHLWYDYLRTYPIKFYRQRVIDYFIADFYCSPARLVIELDGGQHFTVDGHIYDEERTAIINNYGLFVLRFSNSDVDQHFDGVCRKIDQVVFERIRIP